MTQSRKEVNNKIDKVEITEDTLTGRGGMALFVKYINSIMIIQLLMEKFSHIKKSSKGVSIDNFFKQVLCFFYDGTSRHLVEFDRKKSDKGYAAVIETESKDMASSHQAKRMFKAFSWLSGKPFRYVLKKLFIWRLKKDSPKVIYLTIDTMVMDNDEAQKRHGSKPTYAKVKGFQPLQLIWNRKIVDAVFRGGNKHSNYGNTVINMIKDVVKLIRQDYDAKATIILRLDSGFLSEKNFKAFDDLGIGFICSGKMYKGLKECVKALPKEQWGRYDNGRQEWDYVDFSYKCDKWDEPYRTLYTVPIYKNGQMVLEFARPENVIITNIGMHEKILCNLDKLEQGNLKEAKTIVRNHHQRGADELPHRGLKDFGSEELPFKKFPPNQAYYYLMLISFFLFETFKEDVLTDVIPIESYATTVRRRALDFAAKIVKTGGRTILKVTKSTMEDIELLKLWSKSQEVVPIL